MSIGMVENYFENNENTPDNGPDIPRWKNNDNTRDLSASQDLFSDDDQSNYPGLFSPQLGLKNISLDSPISALKTPTLFSRITQETPGKAVVPKTPIDLLPFVVKTNLVWTSEMETPQTKLLTEKPEACNTTMDSTDLNVTPKRRKSQSDKNIKKELNITSPVLGGKKRAKPKVKRRILSSLGRDVENSSSYQNSISSNSDKVSSGAASSLSNDVPSDAETETEKHQTNENNKLLDNNKSKNIDMTIGNNKLLDDDKEKKGDNKDENVDEAVIADKNSNTSTQEFFANLSFSSLDRLYDIENKEEKPSALELQSFVPLDTGQEKNNEARISNELLEKVAAIRKNKKPWKKLNLQVTSIPEADFTRSARELDLADLKFSQEKRVLSNFYSQPLQFKSLAELTSTQANSSVKLADKLPTELKKGLCTSQTFSNNHFNYDMRENIEPNSHSLSKQDTLNHVKKDDESISGTKDSNELAPYNCDESQNTLIASNNLKMNENDKIDEKDILQLYHDLDLEEFLEPKLDSFYKATNKNNLQTTSSVISDLDSDFSTATGKQIKISNEKENYYMKVYQDLSDDQNISISSKTKVNKAMLKNEKKFSLLLNNNDSSSNIKKSFDLENVQISHDGFSTGKGNKIQINEEKEKYFSNVYQNLSDDSNLSDTLKNSMRNQKISESVAIRSKKVNIDKSTTSKIHTTHCESNLEDLNDGFSTARGKSIKISEEKENFYSKMYEEINLDENLIKPSKSFKPVINDMKQKPLVMFNKPLMNNLKRTLSSTIVRAESPCTSKFSTTCSKAELKDQKSKEYQVKDEEIKQLNILPKNISSSESSNGVKIKEDQKYYIGVGKWNEFPTVQAINDKDNILKEENHQIKKEDTTPQELHTVVSTSNEIMEDLVGDSQLPIISKSATVPQRLLDKLPISSQKCLPTQEKGLMSHILKDKLNNIEMKRCQSFGGFSKECDQKDIPAAKLNKSVPNDDNQPLDGLSASQCFDPLSDSLLSKMDISCLNNDDEAETMFKSEKELTGFTLEEAVESFHRFAGFQKVLKNRSTILIINPGDTISIVNKTSSSQHLTVLTENVELKKSKNSCYTLQKVDAIKNEMYKKPLTVAPKAKQKISVVKPQKRKVWSDCDSDTPVTTLKKARMGSELQGKRLFSDDSDVEEPGNLGTTLDVPFETLQQSQKEEEDLTEERLNALILQEKKIKNKKRIKVKPKIGSLLQERLANVKNRISWSDFVDKAVPTIRSTQQIKESQPEEKIFELNAANATCYKFLNSNYLNGKKIVSLNLGDEAYLVFDENGHAGVSEFKEAFLAMPGVDPKLIPTGWVENHYRWIIWKLASMDRIRFNSILLPKMLTPERLMKELKYRYDREIDRAQRPALRKILEKDDVPSKRIVLCISSIKEALGADELEKDVKSLLGVHHWEIEATDGWYSVPLLVDAAMASYVQCGKIKEGTKIITYGAELLDCDRGFYPLEAPANVRLKLFANSTRRARWDTKLGYQKISRPIHVKLRDILQGGGMVGEVTAVVARLYPMIYKEKTADGQFIYRNERSEKKAAMNHEQLMEEKINSAFAEAQKNFDSKQKVDSEDSDEDIKTASSWNHTEKLNQKIECKVRRSLPPPRQVTAVLKVRLVDDATTAILSIWGVNEDSSYEIKEGAVLTVYNVFASGSRGGEMNLTTNRLTHIKNEFLVKRTYPIRICTQIADIGTISFEPKFNEFDTVGIVLYCGPASAYGMKNFDVLNLASPKPDNSGSSYLTIFFFEGIAAFGYQNFFTPGAPIACSNLEWRRNNSWSISSAYCSEKSIFTTNPKNVHLSQEIRNLKALIPHNKTSYIESCKEELAALLTKKPQLLSHNGTPIHSHGTPIQSVRCYSVSPAITPRSSLIQNKLEKLSSYGNVSPNMLSPIVLNNTSNRVKKDFTPVTLRNSDR